YLHCDNTASHYLKVVLDGVFGQKNYRNEITWKRTSTHSDSKTWSRNSDCIFFYTKGAEFVWNTPRDQHSPQYLNAKYRHDDKDGRGLYQLDNMTSPNPRPNLMYVWKGFPWPKKGWRFELATMEKLDAEGRIWYPQNKQGQPDVRKRPRIKRYLAEIDGGVIGSVWSDIAPINSQGRERLGYPTQKPLALLERIVAASSNPGDVLLDPFCGCGTAVHAAQRLDRRWVGIDITHLAISLIEKRLKDAFKGIAFDVHGVPRDIDGARELAGRDKYQFQWWACSLVNAQPYQGKKKGADGGIDGLIFFQDEAKGHKKIVVSVKGGSSVDVAMVRDLAHVVLREKADIGLFLTLTPPTKPMVTEAVKVGYYTSPGTGNAFPKVQILTIAGLLNGTERALFPDLSQGASTFKKAEREEQPGQQSSIF
ncbi:MAG: DNA methyltransferase, partial [Rhodoferax sp.]|nr:DNA methyltransferase [Rhodoferax sp.]